MLQIYRNLLLLMGLLLGLASAVQAADRITARAWLEDRTGQLTFEQVKEQPFAPFDSVLSLGIGKAPVWVRLRIGPQGTTALDPAALNNTLYLKISPVYLDRIQLFDPLDSFGRARITGDQYPNTQDEFRSLSFGFLIPQGDVARDIYLRIETTSTRFFYAQALTQEDLIEAQRWLQIFSGIFIGISILLLAWGVVSWLISREALLFAYVLSQFSGLVFGATLLGHLRYLFGSAVSPVFVDYTTSVSAIAAVGLATYFYWQLFRDFKPPKWGSRGLILVMAVEALALGLVGLGEIRLGIMTNWFVIMLMSPVCLVLVFFCRGWQPAHRGSTRLLPKGILIFYFGTLFLITFTAALGGLGVIGSGHFAIFGGLGNTLFSGIIAFAILQYRATLNQKAQLQMTADLARANDIAEKERGHRLDQGRLLTMLAHEIKTPLSVISLALGTQTKLESAQASARNAIRDIRDIIDQCLEADTIDTARLRANFCEVSLKEVLEQALERIQGLENRLRFSGSLEVRLTSDPRFLRTILFNLLDNARRYGDPNETVEFEVNASAIAEIEISICNAPGALGLPDPDRVFEKYYRSAAAQRVSGTGLGLYLAKQLSEKLGASLRYAADDSKICFRLCLPLCNSQD
jgi:signal transduction histidine kinase